MIDVNPNKTPEGKRLVPSLSTGHCISAKDNKQSSNEQTLFFLSSRHDAKNRKPQ